MEQETGSLWRGTGTKEVGDKKGEDGTGKKLLPLSHTPHTLQCLPRLTGVTGS